MMRLKRIWNIITTAFTVCLVVILLFNVVCYVKRQRGDLCPTVFGVGVAVVLTGSMEPEICIDDLVVIAKQESYAVRDVVTYQLGTSQPVTHRIVEMRTNGDGKIWVTTQGDANNVADEEFSAENIVGKIVFRIPGVGKLQNFLQSSQGFLLLTVAALLLIGLTELFHAISRRR